MSCRWNAVKPRPHDLIAFANCFFQIIAITNVQLATAVFDRLYVL